LVARLQRTARRDATTVDGEAVLVECWPPYDSCRDAVAEMEEMLEERGLHHDYANALAEVIVNNPNWRTIHAWNPELLLRIAHASPAQRARAAAWVLGVEVSDGL
jgi:hypothetical protein